MFYQFKVFVKKITPGFLIDWYHFLITALAALIFGFPGRRIEVIGITGTNGKSTVVQMLSGILEEAGFKVASLSSIRFRINGKDEINDKRMTMPGRFFIQQFLARAIKAGCQFVILEVTSEGIIQSRHRFIGFEAAVFTNLTPEHIESHGSFENYRAAKGRFFKAVKNIHVLNLDDENVGYLEKFEAKEKWGYYFKSKIKNQKSKIQIKNQNIIQTENIETVADGSEFMVNGLKFKIGLLGEFNIYNALAAIAAARSRNISLEACQRALAKINSLPGRMELVIKEPFRVFVDYAFTPNALQKVYQAIQDTKYKIQDTKLICVLGSSGGGRDKWKRPVLGKIAANYCDQIILTNEDPHDEDPNRILSEIKSGITNHQSSIINLYKIIDRREAIVKALGLARAGDVVIITGKGCEPSICLAGGKQIPWDDRKVVREEFNRISN